MGENGTLVLPAQRHAGAQPLQTPFGSYHHGSAVRVVVEQFYCCFAEVNAGIVGTPVSASKSFTSIQSPKLLGSSLDGPGRHQHSKKGDHDHSNGGFSAVDGSNKKR
ncbi:hypothetical protein PG991_014618 [Apiospora marii]|uniref:Uncharacterized protein n=1 Tax=Apiospora marii TaxID=335849 RepID=A0ABR1R474_9PEZI